MNTVTSLRSQRAFTLLEVIITMTIAAILAAMMIPFLSTAVIRSAGSVTSAQDHAQLTQIMENITAEFRRLCVTDATPLSSLSASIGSEGADMNNTYGAYHVITNHRISFPSGSSVTEVPDGSGKILKVKISYKGFELTALFTE